MELKKCQEGHYYDGSIYEECPVCREAKAGNINEGTMPIQSGGSNHTIPLGTAAIGGQTAPLGGGRTAPLEGGRTAPVGAGQTAPLRSGFTAPLTGSGYSEAAKDSGQTIALVQKEMGIDPVVGWLVCISGAEKGRDYRIHSDNNFIGRGETMDICLRGDDTISRINHAVISYDTRERIFYFSRGDGRSIVRLNGKAMFEAAVLQPYDVIEIGKMELIFIPLCGERFEWKYDE